MAPRSLVAVAILCLSCASAAKPGTLYRKGVDAFEADDMAGAATALGAFVDKSCPLTSTDKRCREAYIKLGHAHERLGSPAGAWAAYDAALAFPPHTRDAAVKADLGAHAGAARRAARSRRRSGARSSSCTATRWATISTRARWSVSVDFEPVVTKEKDASDLHGADYRRIWGGSAPVGDHVLLVEAVHDCKPGIGGRCARSRLRKAWSFKSAVHAPVTIQIRAYGEDGEGDAPRTRARVLAALIEPSPRWRERAAGRGRLRSAPAVSGWRSRS